MNMRRLAISLAVSCSVMLVGGIIMAAAIHSSAGRGDETPLHAAAPAANVRVQTLQARTMEDVLTLTGSIGPWEEVTLSAELSGSIEWQGIDDGELVESGQVLLRIDTQSLQARHEQARSQLKLADQELTRIQALSRNGVSSPQDLDRVQANRDVAASDVRVSEIALSKSVVKAPLTGVADRVYREVGEFVDVGTELVRIVQVDRVKVVVGVPEKDVPRFVVGDTVDIVVDALPERAFSGTIYRIATTAEISTRTFATEIEVANPDGLLRPGMIARAILVRETFPDAIAIPIYAAITLDDRYLVFVESEGKAVARSIEVGFYQSNMVHVTSGLDVGDRLIVVGQRDLRDGQSVRVQPASE